MLNHDKILRLFYTEKSNKDLLLGKYHFCVVGSCSKTEVKYLVEKVYNVKVQNVNMLNTKSKIKKFKGISGKTSSYKRAIVTLISGNSISFA